MSNDFHRLKKYIRGGSIENRQRKLITGYLFGWDLKFS
jgi:hypothetical protein